MRTLAKQLLCLIILGWIAGYSAKAIACETREVAALLEQSRQARITGNLDKAYLYVGRALRADPTNLRARYSKALIMIKEGEDSPSQFQSGMAMLTRAAAELPAYRSLPLDERRCPEIEKVYSIFNTIGVEYYLKGNLKKAEAYYLKMERNVDAVSTSSRAKLYNNLALLYQNELNLDKAAAYYLKAKEAGSPKAQERLNAIRQMQGAAPPQH